jgi:NADPH-dependent glutamate synthase beta subunit-like oxidoreductase/NAD-dependent dihydropyrimidine dehydrogenase PreA subunit
MPPVFSREVRRPVITTRGLKFQARTSPCEAACPAGNLVQKVQGLVKENKYVEALEYLRARNPFPGTTGRICTHPCETDCNRREYDEAINIRGLERTVADCADMTKVRKPVRMARSGKRIAVIGGGPAGLTCAYFSSLFGHEVLVFEAGPILGGMPRLSVPDYRLPKDVLDMEVGLVLETGVKARTNTRVGRDISFEEIRTSCDAVVIATGTWKERGLDVPHADKAFKGVEFLRQVNLGQIREIGRNVVIMGGGGVAFDCAFTVKRLGAEEVHVLCLEQADCMCAPSDDLIQARDEGITIHNACMASRVVEKDGHIAGIEFFEVSRFTFDETGQACIEPASDKRHTLRADAVILAVGVQPELDFIKSFGIDLNPNGTIKIDPATMATTRDGVFAAGDTAFGPSIVARAVGQGRETAIAVNQYLTGSPHDDEAMVIGEDSGIRAEPIARLESSHVVGFEELFNLEYYEKAPRKKTAIPTRVSFLERDTGLDASSAGIEAARCFHCGHCHNCGKCVEDCPGLILAMTEKGPDVVYPDECWHCGNCRISCPDAAISYEFPLYTLV